MGTVLICLILAVIVAFSLNSVRRRIRYGSSCCGTHDPLPKKIRVTDKDASHYPYSYRLIVDGMHCSNCVRHVENALNAKDGVWATVKLEDKSVLLRSKTALDEKDISRTVSGVGYTVLEISQKF